MSAAADMQRLRIRGIICVADGEVKPFSDELAVILRAFEAAALVGLKVKLEADQVRVLQRWFLSLGGSKTG
jgi:hypothetical protein